MLYASAGRGFKSGGFNGRANAPGENKPYDPEYVTTYELGAKTRSMEDRLVANFALFYSDYTDFQARVGGANIGEFPVLNAGKMEIYGAEAEFVARPVPAFTLRANLGYLQADYKEFYDPRFPNNDHSMQEPPFAPELTAGLGATTSSCSAPRAT